MKMESISAENAVRVAPSPDVAAALLKARLLAGVANNFAAMREVTDIVEVPRGDIGQKANWGRPFEWLVENDQLVLKDYGCGPIAIVTRFEKIDDDHYYTPETIWHDEVTVVKLAG